MKLIDWMKQKNLDDEAVATLHGDCSAGAVKKWKYGERIPRDAQMRRLIEISEGAVTANDFVGAGSHQQAIAS